MFKVPIFLDGFMPEDRTLNNLFKVRVLGLNWLVEIGTLNHNIKSESINGTIVFSIENSEERYTERQVLYILQWI